jgi:hypothetical protein
MRLNLVALSAEASFHILTKILSHFSIPRALIQGRIVKSQIYGKDEEVTGRMEISEQDS